jgi:hypothetical protein
MAGVAGMTMSRTSLCTLRPRNTSAAWRRSSMRPLVQLPITTWSILMSFAATYATVLVLPGLNGSATVGSISETSNSYVAA